ncbi:MAG TPA: biofilm regulation diguanylate cyclase SiaD [Candidatus Competibacteraceae bacterium]|nr:biofilm regulation diguanylate cyclase SiaD [Candidatus Competibacteraceae bacterium]
MRDDERFEAWIAELLAAPEHRDHPLHEALATLFQRYQEQVHQLERVARISDRYQSLEHERSRSLAERYRRQLRQLEKIARISDRYQTMLREVNQTLRELSIRDALTGLYNRRYMLERLSTEAALVQRQGTSFGLAICDIDHFKRINDRHGHDAGDQVLAEIACCLHGSLRDYDVCARWGGEEFLFLFPETDSAAALAIMERLRTTVAELCPLIEGSPLALSISAGITEHRAQDAIRDSLRRADHALYQAKHSGRNRCVVA